MAKQIKHRFENEFLDSIFHELQMILVKTALSDSQIQQIIRSLADFLIFRWGGDRPYIITRKRLEQLLRNHRILDQFDGTNHEAICAEFGISKKTLSRIVEGQN